MSLGWKYLIELAFVWAMISAIVVVGADQGGTGRITVPCGDRRRRDRRSGPVGVHPGAGESIEEIR